MLDRLSGIAAFFGRLAVRNLLRQGRRTMLTLSAIVLGVAGLVVAGGFVEDVFVQLGEGTVHSQIGHLQVFRDGYRTKGAQRPLAYLIDDPQQVIATIRRSPQVQDAMARLHFAGLVSNGATDAAALIDGVEPAKEALVGTLHQILEGRRLADSDEDGVYVGEGLARALRLHAGQRVNLVTNTAGGALNTLEFRVVGVFRSYSKEYDERAAMIPLRTARELLQTTGANTIVAVLRETAATSSVVSHLRSVLPPGLDVVAWFDLSDFYTKTVQLFSRQFGFLQLVILLLIVLSVLNTINLNMQERRGEFGTMRAIGNTDRDIAWLIVTEAALLGIAGSVAGIIAGALLAAAISAIGIPMPPPPNAELGYVARIRVDSGLILAAAAIGAGASVIASLSPARRISRMPIVEALRQNV